MRKGPFFISLIYFIIGMLWILYSDWFTYHLFSDADIRSITIYQNIKGGAYIIFTTALLYAMIALSQKKLRNSQKYYLELFQCNPNPMMIYDKDSFRFQEINEAAINLYGYSRSEFLSMNVTKIYEEEYASEKQYGSKDDIIHGEIGKHKHKNSNIIHVRVSTERVTFKKKQGILLMVQDISKQKEYEDQLISITRNLEVMINKRTEELKTANKELSLYNQQLTLSNKQLFIANQKIKEQSDIIQKQNQENLNRIINSLNDVVWSVDLRSKKYIYLSSSIEKVTGVSYQVFKDSINKWIRLVHPDDKHIIKNRQKWIFNKGYSDTIYRLLRSDGEIVWIHDKVNLIRDNQGQPIMIEGLAADITSLKRAQDELMKYANRLNLILESITDGFFTLNKELRFTRVNIVFERLVGIERYKLLGKSVWDIFPPNLYPELFLRLSNAMEQNETSGFQGYFRQLDAWFDIKFYPYIEGLSIFMRDISEEKKIQQEVSFSKKNLDALINNTTDLILSIDKNMYVLSANKAFIERFETRFGVTVKVGHKFPEIQLDDEITYEWEQQFLRAFKGESFTTINKSMVDDVEECFEISFNPIYSDNEEVVGIGCFGRNITVRRQYEQERNHLIEKLIAQNNGLEEFGYVTSHKMRAPVANILGIVNLLNKDNLKDEFSKSLIDYLRVSAHNLDQTIKDLTSILDMQRVGQEIIEEVALNEVYDQAIKVLKPLIKESKAIVCCEFSEIQKAYAVKSSLVNIMVQLITNSIIYKKPDEIPEIRVKSFVEDGYAAISISDNGLGIDLPKYKDQLFKLYKRFHLHTPGKGIGLYLVKSQVDALDGKLEVNSKINEGTTFKVYLKNKQPVHVVNGFF